MRVHAGLAEGRPDIACRALVAGFGLPGMRDLDFGRQFVDYAEALTWPGGVVVEDLSLAPHLVLHRLQELCPATLIFVGSVERGTAMPGTIRHYRLGLPQPDPEEVHLGLTAGLAGVAGFHHTLRVLRHWGGLPADTVVVEVEPADTSFGFGFSEDVGSAIEKIVDIVRAEIGGGVDLAGFEDPAEDQGTDQDVPVLTTVGKTHPGIADLAEYARLHDGVDQTVARFRDSLVTDLPRPSAFSVTADSRRMGKGVRTKGDWCEVLPLADDWVGVVMGDVVEEGLAAALAMSQLRGAVRSAVLDHGLAPGEVVARVDRVVRDTGVGRSSTLIYLVADAATGEVRLANAGHCRPLLLSGEGTGTFVDDALSPALGTGPHEEGPRPETTIRLAPEGSLLVYTDGLLAAGRGPADPLKRLTQAAATASSRGDDLCRHVLSRCLGGFSRSDDASLLVLARSPQVQGGGVRPEAPGHVTNHDRRAPITFVG